MRRVGAATVTALAIAASAGCGGGDDDEAASAEEVPKGSVAVVGDTPITKQQLDRRIAALRRSTGKRSSPIPREQLELQALSGLLRQEATEQEAAERGVTVDRREVRRRWAAVKQAQFRDRKAVKRFLGGQTEQELLRQLRLQALTDEIHDQIREDGGAAAVERFERSFQKRWAERTACRAGYSVVGCAAGDRSE